MLCAKRLQQILTIAQASSEKLRNRLKRSFSLLSSRRPFCGSLHDAGILSESFAAFGTQAANCQWVLSLECFFHANVVGFFQLRQVAGKIPLGESAFIL